MAWLGGKIKSNKEEALQKFYERKQRQAAEAAAAEIAAAKAQEAAAAAAAEAEAEAKLKEDEAACQVQAEACAQAQGQAQAAGAAEAFAEAEAAEAAKVAAENLEGQALRERFAAQLRVLGSMGFQEAGVMLPLLEIHNGDLQSLIEELYQ